MKKMLNEMKQKIKKFLHNQKGAGSDEFITLIGLFLAATAMFIIPLVSMAEKNDKISQSVWDEAVSGFVDTVSNAGSIKPTDYEELQDRLASTGNTYEIIIEIQHLDDNPGKKATTTSGDLIGENIRYSTYTSEILDYMYPNGGSIDSMIRDYPLKKGDNIIVTVRNTNETLAQQLRKFLFKVTGQGTYELASTDSSMVVNNGK